MRKINELPFNNSYVVPTVGQYGGLWLVWGDEVKVRYVKSSRFYIMAEVQLNDEKASWGLAGVYGDPTRDVNHVIWEEISNFLNQVEGRVCLIGDFNAITDPMEKRGGCSNLGVNNIAFRRWIHSNDLLDLGHHVPCYTWSNKQQG